MPLKNDYSIINRNDEVIMGCTFNNSVVHGEMNKSCSETHYFCLHPSCGRRPPSCRCEFVGSSGGCSSGQGVRDVCDSAQEGQLEVSFVCKPFFAEALSPLSPPVVTIFLFIFCVFLSFFCYFAFISASVFLLSRSLALPLLLCGCMRWLSQCDMGLECTVKG